MIITDTHETILELIKYCIMEHTGEDVSDEEVLSYFKKYWRVYKSIILS